MCLLADRKIDQRTMSFTLDHGSPEFLLFCETMDVLNFGFDILDFVK